MTAILREQRAGFDVCLAPWQEDAHADHEAAGRAAQRAELSDLDVALGGTGRPAGSVAPGAPATAHRGGGGSEEGGTLLAVHWRHPVADYPRSGDDVHQALAAQSGLARLVQHTEPDFLAEVYIRTDGVPVSVAQATGLT